MNLPSLITCHYIIVSNLYEILNNIIFDYTPNRMNSQMNVRSVYQTSQHCLHTSRATTSSWKKWGSTTSGDLSIWRNYDACGRPLRRTPPDFSSQPKYFFVAIICQIIVTHHVNCHSHLINRNRKSGIATYQMMIWKILIKVFREKFQHWTSRKNMFCLFLRVCKKHENLTSENNHSITCFTRIMIIQQHLFNRVPKKKYN